MTTILLAEKFLIDALGGMLPKPKELKKDAPPGPRGFSDGDWNMANNVDNLWIIYG